MWLKLPGYRSVEFVDFGQLYVLGSRQYRPGIYFRDELLLIAFETCKEAEESYDNLFRAMSAHRQSLYLVAQGTQWVIEPVGKIMDQKGGK